MSENENGWSGEQPRPSETEEQAAQREQLRTLPPQVLKFTTPQKEELPDVPEEVLPTDLKSAYSLLTLVENLPANTKAESHVRDVRLQRIRKHVFAMQQGSTAPIITADDQAKSAQAVLNGEQRRNARATTLNAAIGRLAGEPEPQDDAILNDIAATPKQRLLASATVKTSLVVCKGLVMLHELFSLKNFDHAYPQDRVTELRNELGDAKCPIHMDEVKSKIAALDSHDSIVQSRRVIGIISNDFQYAEKSLRLLVEQSVALVKSMREKAINREAAWFSLFNLPHEQTTLSRRYDLLLAELNNLPINAQTLHWFGITDVAA